MASEEQDVPLNAVRAFVTIARERSVTGAAAALGTTQSSISRHLAVLEDYLGASLFERRGRSSDLSDYGRLFANAVTESLDTICFTARRMRRRNTADVNRLIVRTSLSTFATHVLIPHLSEFSKEMGGATVDVVTSLAMPSASDRFDVLVTRDLHIAEPGDHWEIYREQLICVGSPTHLKSKGLASIRSIPILSTTSRPDILPTWLRGMDMTVNDIVGGARVDHHYLALPAAMTGKCLLVAPEIVVAQCLQDGFLKAVSGTRTPSGMHYRAYALDRSSNPELARAFCRWLARLCRGMSSGETP
ncbi:LysR family glycine cleavage system transcriptional activator [Rhizobium sp. BK313]|uniref:LysR family transcriptional regulator n=1 Tax=Rhizobium sp. BK313 TaxID=2587081 RepID=UPI0017B309E1|nr:LysR family transcriptional regulator [Rhizobium sp. BK313]MBB3458805.1 LysR family glycine cleavage system transcriptional activator [Rhizobium sp. BK313]